MKLQAMGQAALMACLATIVSQAYAVRQREYQNANQASQAASASLATYSSFDPSDDGSYVLGESGALGECCGECGGECCDASCGCASCGCPGYGCGRGVGGFDWGASLLRRPGQIFAYADYIYARARFSEAPGWVVQDPNDPEGGQVFNQLNFDYNSSYRFGGGYRFCDCGGEIVFNYARYRSDADFRVQGIAGTSPGAEIMTPYEVDAFDETQFVTGNAEVDLNSYDLGFAKTIPLGSPLGCGGCACGDCCECGDCCSCWCPAWDIQWSAGVRFAEGGWTRGTAAFQEGSVPPPTFIDSAETRLNFDGVGARVGLLGRRYIGRNGWLSIYARGDLSVLVSRIQIRTDTTDPQAGTLRVAETSCRHTVPVTEIEAGLTGHLGCHLRVSSGYFLAAWHDLGMRDTYDFGGQLSHYDDANILGFDGFFARVEAAF